MSAKLLCYANNTQDCLKLDFLLIYFVLKTRKLKGDARLNKISLTLTPIRLLELSLKKTTSAYPILKVYPRH